MENKTRLLMTVVGVVSVMLMAGIFSSRQATLLAQGEQAIETERIQHCAVLLAPAVSEEAESESIDLGCFNSEEEMESAVQNVSIEGSSPDNSLVNTYLAQFWFGPNYTGTSFYFYEIGDNDGCRDGNWFNYTLPTVYRYNIESARSYSGCDELYLYRYTNRTGESITCNQGDYTCRNLGFMRNRATSIRANP